MARACRGEGVQGRSHPRIHLGDHAQRAQHVDVKEKVADVYFDPLCWVVRKVTGQKEDDPRR
jgi:hypothetical protein